VKEIAKSGIIRILRFLITITEAVWRTAIEILMLLNMHIIIQKKIAVQANMM
tara:strand:- start:443 stop:598 length:156 start_codon:yes stop_codon:yes gene_type:complete